MRETLDILSELVPLERIEVDSGTKCFDWTIPKEWVVRDAYVIDPNGQRILEVKRNNLHLVSYSIPFRGRITREELDANLFSLPDQPRAIPYVTSYYLPRWGFCIEHEKRQKLPDGIYEVVVDTDLIDGSLTIGEAVLPGATKDEILISTYICHPSIANNELSGPLVAAFLWQHIAQRPFRKYTYRFVFAPETIGSVAYLSLRGEHLRQHLAAGYVVTCVGTDAALTYKRSRRGNSLADRAALHVLNEDFEDEFSQDLPFFPNDGSDERQYCSPGFNLPVGSLMRSVYGTYPEYHTSLDNRDFVSFEAMAETIGIYAAIIDALEANGTWERTNPFCEPQLGQYGLYPSVNALASQAQVSDMMWFLNYADGLYDLIEISRISGVSLNDLEIQALRCAKAGLVVEVPSAIGAASSA